MDSTRRSNPRNPSLSSSSGSTRYVPRKFPSNHPTNSTVPSPNPNHGTGISGRTTSNQLKSTNRQEEDTNNPVSLAGTCPFMCPAGERVQRERLRDLAIFERLNGNPGKTSPELAVKKFCRTISSKDTHASDLRPLLVLDNTLKYLLNMIDSTERPFEEVHDFIFDRTRSIRQDLSIQNIVNDQAIQMYEEMVKFHIISHHKLRSCNSSPNISSMHYLNMEQLTKSLTSLYNLYEANRRSNLKHENEAEYHSFYVLLHLNSISEQSVHLCSHCSSSSFSFLNTIMNYLLDPKLDISISDPQGESLSLWFRNVSSNIIKSQEMCFARRVLRFLRMGNYKQFLSIVVTEASYLQYCIIEPYMNEVRALALSYINHGCYKLHPYPLADLATVLMMKDSDAESLCNSCGLEVYTDEVGNKFLPTKQTSFCYPKEGFQKYCCLGLERYERKNTARGM